MRQDSRATRNRARAAYLREVERRVIATRPELAGRLDWDTALHCYQSGHPIERTVRALIVAGGQPA